MNQDTNFNINTNANGIKTGVSDNPFLIALQNRLTGDVGISTSNSTGVDAAIGEVINQLQTGQKARATAITNRAERTRAETEALGQSQIISAREARRGNATNMAVLQQLQKSVDASLKDLDQREQEALANNEADTAFKIADLKMKQLEFKQQATQQAFQNLLSTANVYTQLQNAEITKQNERFNLAKQQLDFLNNQGLLTNLNNESKRTFEAQLGLPVGSLNNIAGGKELNVQSVPGVGLVNVTRDGKGNPKIDILVRSQDQSPTNQLVARNTTTAQFLNNRVGQDELVAPETYIQAKNLYINQGGTLDEFKKVFPPQRYLSVSSQSFVPPVLRQEDTSSLDLNSLANPNQ